MLASTLFALAPLACSLPPPSSSCPADSADFIVVTVRDGRGNLRETSLNADHGVLIEWPLTGAPTFHRFDRARGLRERTDDPQRFLRALRRLPRGTTVEVLDRCQAGFRPGMPAEFSRALDQLFIDREFRAPERFIICICESTEVTILSGS